MWRTESFQALPSATFSPRNQPNCPGSAGQRGAIICLVRGETRPQSSHSGMWPRRVLWSNFLQASWCVTGTPSLSLLSHSFTSKIELPLPGEMSPQTCVPSKNWRKFTIQHSKCSNKVRNMEDTLREPEQCVPRARQRRPIPAQGHGELQQGEAEPQSYPRGKPKTHGPGSWHSCPGSS